MIVLRVLMYIGLGIACLAGAYILYMLIIAVIPGFKVPRQPLPKHGKPVQRARRADTRGEVDFPVEGTQVRGWLYLPDGRVSAPYPCIVMAHGLGATRAMGLDAYARRFQDAGIAVLAFVIRKPALQRWPSTTGIWETAAENPASWYGFPISWPTMRPRSITPGRWSRSIRLESLSGELP